MNIKTESTGREQLMIRYGITAIQRTVYVYGDYRYERLEDALAYAKLELSRKRVAAADSDDRRNP